jgi:hypothetical protein
MKNFVLPKDRRVFTARSAVPQTAVPETVDFKVDGVVFKFWFQFDIAGIKAVYKSLIGDWLTVPVI